MKDITVLLYWTNMREITSYWFDVLREITSYWFDVQKRANFKQINTSKRCEIYFVNIFTKMELHKKLSSYSPLLYHCLHSQDVPDFGCALKPTHLRWFWHTLSNHRKLGMHKDEHQLYRLNRSIQLFLLFY
jgi:hypothetical protein